VREPREAQPEQLAEAGGESRAEQLPEAGGEQLPESSGEQLPETAAESEQLTEAGAEGAAYAAAEGAAYAALESAAAAPEQLSTESEPALAPEGAATEGEAAEGIDPDEAHFQEVFERFLELRRETGEPSNVSYDKFVAKLRRNREELMERHHAKGVRFSVYLKDGRAAIKASALR
jgi:hypothetical protein